MRILALAAIVCVVSSAAVSRTAEARPLYLKHFAAEYPEIKDAIDKAKCTVCHPVAKKAVQNDYGMALGKALGAKNVKNANAIKDAVKEVEKVERKDGKTFGEVIESGELPID